MPRDRFPSSDMLWNQRLCCFFGWPLSALSHGRYLIRGQNWYAKPTTEIAIKRYGQQTAVGQVTKQLTPLPTSAFHLSILIASIKIPSHSESDSRVEADICRQLEASALLMLPIYQGHTLAGVFAVLFAEPHTFPNREVGAYQLMTSLVAESISPQVEKRIEYKQPATQSTVSHAILRMTSEMRKGSRPQFRREPQRLTETAGASEVPAVSARHWSSWR
jgi:hypothetical protein